MNTEQPENPTTLTSGSTLSEQDKALRAHILFKSGSQQISSEWENHSRKTALERITEETEIKASQMALHLKKLGGFFEDSYLANLLDQHPALLKEDDGGEEWFKSYRKFMFTLLKEIDNNKSDYISKINQQANPILGKNGTKGIEKIIEDNAAQAAKITDKKDKRIEHVLSTLYKDPEKAAQSTLTHLKRDQVVWSIKMQHLSKKIGDPRHKQLMDLLIDVTQKNKLDEVFNLYDCQKISGLSYELWLLPNEANQQNLRWQAALQLGEILDNPERRESTVDLLQSFSKKTIPGPLTFEQKEELLNQFSEMAAARYPTESDQSGAHASQSIAQIFGMIESKDGKETEVNNFLKNYEDYLTSDAAIIKAARRINQAAFNSSFLSTSMKEKDIVTLKQQAYETLLKSGLFEKQLESHNHPAVPKPKVF